MARLLRAPGDLDEAQARAALLGAGVQLLDAADPEGGVDTALLELLLEPEARFVRDILTAEPPRPGSEASGMGAWHVNGVDEVHSVLDGTGIMEFVTGAGIVSVMVEGGDVIVIQQAEHRYLPLRPQRWAVRWAGPADGGLVATETGRSGQPWPTA